MKKWITTAVVMGTISVALTAWAVPQNSGRHHGKSGRPEGRSGGGMEGGRGIGLLIHHPEIATKVGITDEQLEQLRDLDYQNRRARIPLESELSLARLDMEHLIAQEEPDSATVNKAIEDVGRIQTELVKLQIQQRLAVRKIVGVETMEKIQQAVRKKMSNQRKNRQDSGKKESRRFSKKGKNRPVND